METDICFKFVYSNKELNQEQDFAEQLIQDLFGVEEWTQLPQKKLSEWLIYPTRYSLNIILLIT